MKRTLIALAALPALAVAACASAPESPAPVQLGTGTAEGWAAGNAEYLRINGERRGWTTTESGLQYRRIGRANPEGRQPASTDTVKVHYRGIAADGKEIDSSYKRGEPAEFPVNRVIPCWREGLQLMKEGGKAKLSCPPATTYGMRGSSALIPSNTTMQFEIELLSVR